MAAQARDVGGAVAVGPRATAGLDGDGQAEAEAEPADAILRADAVGWPAVARTLLDKTRGYRASLALTFVLGIARVAALIGVGVLSALAVRAVKRGEPVAPLLVALGIVAPLAGLLHWVESWLAHDVAYRLLTDMRLDVFRKLDSLAPAYLTRRRTGDLVGVATHDGGLVVIVTGAWLARAGRLDPAALPLLTLLALSAFVPLWEVAQVGRQLADTLGAARRLHAVESEPVPVRDGRGVDPRSIDGGAIAVELTDVRFTYPGRTRPALDGVSLRIEAGSTVALVGPSGAGKTTVASLLLRFWDPQAGAVRLLGHDLRDYGLDDLRRRIALVAQDTYLFHDTLRANILLAQPEASERQVHAAIEH